MILVIPCAATKRSVAGHLRTPDDRQVMFVANPDTAPADGRFVYARPDDSSGDASQSWRAVLMEYNRKYNECPGENPWGLLPAWRLYAHPTYKFLKKRLGLDRLFILSAGWGLIPATFLTPKYDITFSRGRNVEPFKRRYKRDQYHDFHMLPPDVSDPIVFVGGKNYTPLFCALTAGAQSERTVFYVGHQPAAPGCKLQRYRKRYIGWYYECAKELVTGKIQLGAG